MTKATYEVPQKTGSAELFDARPQLGTGGIKLKELRETRPSHAPVIDRLWHLASHVNGIVIRKERDSGMVAYNEVNPAAEWGRATTLARGKMHSIDPKKIIANRQVF